jgi:succinylglutamate desuccinylase
MGNLKDMSEATMDLNVVDALPDGLLDLPAHDLHRLLPGPSLIHLSGRRPEPLFVSVLLHGDEDGGWEAMRQLLQRYPDAHSRPRALSVFIGNIAAARDGVRFLPGQPDYNRIWEDHDGNESLPERGMMRQVAGEMEARKVFASIDVHNNSGINPHYGCVRSLDDAHLHLAALFSRTVVYFRTPIGVQTGAFSPLCPAVTIEAGKAGQAHGVEHVLQFLDAALHLAQWPEHPVARQDVDLFHTVAVCKVPATVTFGFGEAATDIDFAPDLDHLNFRELPAGTALAQIHGAKTVPLRVENEDGVDVTERFFCIRDGELRTTLPVMPSMLSVNPTAIRQDCLCYLMERYPGFANAQPPADPANQ